MEQPEPQMSDLPTYAQVAVNFARALVDGELVRASEFLSPDLRREYPPDALADRLHQMYRLYAKGPPRWVRWEWGAYELPMQGDPQNDLGWAYVPISGDGFNEAVTVTIADFAGVPLIRELEWGRP